MGVADRSAPASGIIAGRYAFDPATAPVLGSGGSATVYEGQDTYTGEPVAIKALNPEAVAERPNAAARFRREAALMQRLQHPHIVEFHAEGEVFGRHCIVMEKLCGGMLSHMRQVPYEPSDVVRSLIPIAEALAYLHRDGTIHRDVKPSNILLTEGGTPKLSDFGAAFEHGQPHDKDTLIGTVDYMSPEAIAGRKPDTRADVWSFGMMLYVLIAGHPHTADTTHELMLNILNHPVPSLFSARRDLPPRLAALVTRMLAHDFRQRLRSMEAAGTALKTLL